MNNFKVGDKVCSYCFTDFGEILEVYDVEVRVKTIRKIERIMFKNMITHITEEQYSNVVAIEKEIEKLENKILKLKYKQKEVVLFNE